MAPVSLRLRTPDDDPFLYALYSEWRSLEFDFLPPEQKNQLIRLQYLAQSRAYDASYPDSDWQIVLCGDESVGRIRISRSAEAIELVEILIAQAARNRGIGATVIEQLKAEAIKTHKPVRACVSTTNPGSLRFHQRLGFQIVRSTDTQLYVEWRA
ncbi:MAG TPA: GNAT family N-acetyltransferase [Bryobacteraceae bacterium]|jgi:RimJ/RimL family protein N-acetyltransferase|nr:GNAT family N-acetyltransferase [Bryobacteraceae bacterium]